MSWCVYDSLAALITERRHPGESSAEMDPLTVLEARGPKQGVGRAVLLAKVLNWGIICRPVQLLAPSTFLCCGCVAPASPSPHGLAPRVSVSLLISQTLWTVAHQAPLSMEVLRILESVAMPSFRESSWPRD